MGNSGSCPAASPLSSAMAYSPAVGHAVGVALMGILTWISNGTESARNMLVRDTSFKAGDRCVGSGAVCVERCILGTQKGDRCFGRTLVEH